MKAGLHSLPHKLLAGLISTFLLASTPSIAHRTTQTIEPAQDHSAPGTKLPRFERIDEGVFKGSEPKNDADYRFLQSKHVRYIVAMKFLPLLDRLEVHRARKYGILLIPTRLK